MQFTSRSILIIDDNIDLLELLHEALAAAGHRVRTAGSGREALALLREEPADLILLDVRMPVMDGQAFLDALERQDPRAMATATVVFTSAGRPPVDHRVRGFVDKMTDLSDYLREIERYAAGEDLPATA